MPDPSEFHKAATSLDGAAAGRSFRRKNSTIRNRASHTGIKSGKGMGPGMGAGEKLTHTDIDTSLDEESIRAKICLLTPDP